MDVMWVCQENISRFKNRIAKTHNALERKVLMDLLEREEKLLRTAGENERRRASEVNERRRPSTKTA